jgi:hypothetical protein
MFVTTPPSRGNPAQIKLRGGRPQYFAGAKYMAERKPKVERSKPDAEKEHHRRS